jgi:hopanoid biosynthesis associated protein HpnK
VRRLILNADDFGLTTGVNRAIAEAHERGVVTSATLMAGGAAFADAAQRAAQLPRLSVGCHVVLLDGAPVLPASDLPTLAPGGARLRNSLADFWLAALRGRVDAAEVERETTAQIRKLQAAGIQVTHVDAHKHAHLLPQVLAPVLRAALACGVAAVRNPFGPLRALALAHLVRRPRLWRRTTEFGVLRAFAERFRREVAAAGMTTTDGSFGVIGTGALDAALFESIIGCIPEGTWEFVCHPGYNDSELAQVRTRLRDSRVRELEVLTAGATRAVLERCGVELISYRDLQVPQLAKL